MASSAVVAGLGLPQLALAEQSDGSDAEALPLNANDDLEFSFTPDEAPQGPHVLLGAGAFFVPFPACAP